MDPATKTQSVWQKRSLPFWTAALTSSAVLFKSVGCELQKNLSGMLQIFDSMLSIGIPWLMKLQRYNDSQVACNTDRRGHAHVVSSTYDCNAVFSNNLVDFLVSLLGQPARDRHRRGRPLDHG